ncbi:maleylpyruvate isomerase N-terminal domain-containing protein [Enemella evansiae]|uniref:maleylpyruvate isomerase N-terminal domain-containing protein n=1 Tax=Enemella evansiae TaxID=2016499 RepID=UPI000B96FB4A|nr:maleylpyruvate isomerase N-terminal domain-containing protein [Enemella evansiae]OYO05631.1 TIGR03086 family protein [Enemella evansiae]
MTRLPELPIAEKFRLVARSFSERVDGVDDWDAPTPVKEWRARDVVDHLHWIRDVLGDAVTIEPGPSADDDPPASWAHLSSRIQGILDDPASMDLPHSHPHTGDNPVPVLIDRIWTGDVFFHTWDLARSAGLDDTLDADLVHDSLVGMRQAEAFLRPTGQFGEQQPEPPGATDLEQLMAFLGRDPRWRPPVSR